MNSSGIQPLGADSIESSLLNSSWLIRTRGKYSSLALIHELQILLSLPPNEIHLPVPAPSKIPGSQKATNPAFPVFATGMLDPAYIVPLTPRPAPLPRKAEAKAVEESQAKGSLINFNQRAAGGDGTRPRQRA